MLGKHRAALNQLLGRRLSQAVLFGAPGVTLHARRGVPAAGAVLCTFAEPEAVEPHIADDSGQILLQRVLRRTAARRSAPSPVTTSKRDGEQQRLRIRNRH